MKTTKLLLETLTLTCGLAVSGYSQVFLTNGLVAYYPLEGNANDASGLNQNGTAYNGVTYASHLSGLAAHLSGEAQGTFLCPKQSPTALILQSLFG